MSKKQVGPHQPVAPAEEALQQPLHGHQEQREGVAVEQRLEVQVGGDHSVAHVNALQTKVKVSEHRHYMVGVRCK